MDNLDKNRHQNKNCVSSLKAELKKLGAKTSGNKETLIKRLNIWTEKKLNRTLCAPDYHHQSACTEGFDTQEELNTPITENPSVIINETVLSTELKSLRDINNSVFDFINISSISEWFSNKHALASLDRGLRLAQHNFINRISCKSESNKLLIAGSCFAEKTKHKVDTIKLIFIEQLVNSANCECVAGAGMAAACKHIGAIMFGLQYYGSTGKSLERLSPTSSLQLWHQPSLTKTTSKTKVIDYIKQDDQSMYTHLYAGKDKNSELQNLFINNLLKSTLNARRNVNAFAYFDDHRYCINMERLIVDAINKVSELEREHLKYQTVHQNRSKKWHDLRKSRITASIAANVTSTVRSGKFCRSVAIRIINPKVFSTAATRWGIANEKKALMAYERTMGVKIKEIGLCIDAQFNFLAATPDGITENGTTVIEIKCPYSQRNADNVDNLKYLINGSLKKSHKYYLQCQMQMRVTNTKNCDFIIWGPKFIKIINILYNEDYIKENISLMDEYYAKIFCREYILSKWN